MHQHGLVEIIIWNFPRLAQRKITCFQVCQCMMKALLVSTAQLVHRSSHANSFFLLTRNLLKEDKCVCSKWIECCTHFGDFESMHVNDRGSGFGRH